MTWVSNRLDIWKQHRAEQRQKATERIAHTLYQRRVLLNREGDQSSDWATAEKIIKNPFRRTLFESKQPSAQAMKFIVWDTPRWFLFSLPHLEWVKLLAVPLVIAAAGSIITGQIQREANQNAVLKAYFDKLEELTFEQNLLAEKQNQGAIVLARGRTVAALHELDLTRRAQLIAFLQASNLTRISEEGTEPIISFKGQNLSTLNLSSMALSGIDFQSANLRGANLDDAELEGSDLRRAELFSADLRDTYLGDADLRRAFLRHADMRDTFLGDADLRRAFIVRANLRDAFLDDADLRRAFLLESNLRGTSLGNADLRRASLLGSDLRNADLAGANLRRANLQLANLQRAQNWTDEQLGQAKLCNTKLPEGSKLDPNRDCSK